MSLKNNIIEILESRGLIENLTSKNLKKYTEAPRSIYVGIDPTSDCLHLGNFVGIAVLRWFQLCGHQIVLVLGGATGMIGDPSGKSKERNLLDEETLNRNLEGIRRVSTHLLPQGEGLLPPKIVSNYDWFKEKGFIEFLRETGKYFRMGVMLSKDSVQSRLNSEEGISFTEFCYQTLQAYDFYHLIETEGVTIQAGGSDQWGNITAGIDLIGKKTEGKEAYGIVWPLLVRSDGQKFGKSEEGAVWLSDEKLSPYKFYQHLLKVSDEDVFKFMKLLTFMPLEEINQLESEVRTNQHPPGYAQKRFSSEMTLIVHGEKGLENALKATEAASPGKNTEFNLDAIEAIENELPSIERQMNQVIDLNYIDLLIDSGLVPSKGAARRMIQNGGAYLNNERVSEMDRVINQKDILGSKYLILSVGKKSRILVKVISN